MNSSRERALPGSGPNTWCRIPHSRRDAICFGKLVGTIHSQPHEWFKKYKNTPKPQWEEWQDGAQTNQLAMDMRDTYGDYAAMIVLMFGNFEHRGANMKALGKSIIELLPLLCGQLTTDVMKTTRHVYLMVIYMGVICYIGHRMVMG